MEGHKLNWFKTLLHESSPKPLLPTTSPPSYSSFTGSQSNKEFNSKFFGTLSKLFTTLPLLTCLISCASPLQHAPSDPPLPSTSLSPLYTSAPWGAEYSATLLPSSGTPYHPTSVIPTLSLFSKPDSKPTCLKLPIHSIPNCNTALPLLLLY